MNYFLTMKYIVKTIADVRLCWKPVNSVFNVSDWNFVFVSTINILNSPGGCEYKIYNMTTLNDIIKNIIIVYNHKCSRDCKTEYITIQIEHFVLFRI